MAGRIDSDATRQEHQHVLLETAAKGQWGGLTSGPVVGLPRRRIRCAKGGDVCALLMPEHPLHGHTFGVAGTITPLVDLWLDERRLPAHMRLVPKPGFTYIGPSTPDRMRRGGLRGAACDPRDFDVDGRVCDGCAEIIEPTDKFRSVAVAGVDVQLHDAGY